MAGRKRGRASSNERRIPFITSVSRSEHKKSKEYPVKQATWSQRVELVSAVFDYTDHVGTAEEWLVKNKGLSFNDLSEKQAGEMLRELKAGK